MANALKQMTEKLRQTKQAIAGKDWTPITALTKEAFALATAH